MQNLIWIIYPDVPATHGTRYYVNYTYIIDKWSIYAESTVVCT